MYLGTDRVRDDRVAKVSIATERRSVLSCVRYRPEFWEESSAASGSGSLCARSLARARTQYETFRVPMSLGMQVRSGPAVSPRSGPGPRPAATTNINIQVNIETEREERTDRYKHNTSRHRTQDGRRRRIRGRRMQAGPPAVHTSMQDTVSAIRSTDGSRRTFRGTGHSKIHDSPLCARTHAPHRGRCVRAQRC